MTESISTSRIAIVTGANKGIGFHIAKKLGAAGVHVLVGARDPGRGESAVAALRKDGVTADVLALDVTSSSSIASAVASVTSAHGRLDILVNNAGIVIGQAPPSTVVLDDLRKVYETNVLGVVATTNAFLPLLRASAAPRIVNVSSGLGSFATMTDPSSAYYGLNAAAYQSSKAALDALTVMYAKELRGHAVQGQRDLPGLPRDRPRRSGGEREPRCDGPGPGRRYRHPHGAPWPGRPEWRLLRQQRYAPPVVSLSPLVRLHELGERLRACLVRR